MNNEPTFSVVIPLYNNAKMATRAILSVLRQSCAVKEIILVDDASSSSQSDKYRRLVERCKFGVDIVFHALAENVGPGFARHAGAALATGSYVCFLDADDVWHRQKIELVRKAILDVGAELVGHQRIWRFQIPKKLLSNNFPTLILRPIQTKEFLKKNSVPTSSITAKTEIARVMFRFGGRKAEDYMALVYSSKLSAKFWFIDLPLCAAYKPPSGHSGEGADQLAIYLSSATNMNVLMQNKIISYREILTFYIFLSLKMPIGMFKDLYFQNISAKQKRNQINASQSR